MRDYIFNSPKNRSTQAGFTLIELMISLVLGLLISAAVVQIYITNFRTSTVQKSGSELQDASVFGIQMLESHIRLANLGNSALRITDTTLKGGVVLTTANITTGALANSGVLLSHSAGDTPNSNKTIGWSGESHTVNDGGTKIPSDQLTIQFTNLTEAVMPDCEGNNIDLNEIVIERYFLRPATADATRLVLACDAGRIDVNAAGEPTGFHDYGTDSRSFGQAGQEFIQNVDQFKVLLGTQETATGSNNLMQYIPSRDYLALATVKPAIVSVKIGMIVHGSTALAGSEDAPEFTVLGQKNKLPVDANRKKQARTTYESTTTLRNARVII